jgi:hypothetical protein
VERRDAAWRRAIDTAVGAAARAVRRSVQRRRMKPLRRKARPASRGSRRRPGAVERTA